MIVRKLQYAAQGGGDRHLRDIAKMLEREVVAINHDVVRDFAAERGLLAGWTSAHREMRER